MAVDPRPIDPEFGGQGCGIHEPSTARGRVVLAPHELDDPQRDGLDPPRIDLDAGCDRGLCWLLVEAHAVIDRERRETATNFQIEARSPPSAARMPPTTRLEGSLRASAAFSQSSGARGPSSRSTVPAQTRCTAAAKVPRGSFSGRVQLRAEPGLGGNPGHRARTVFAVACI
jgi:hypothetical protein